MIGHHTPVTWFNGCLKKRRYKRLELAQKVVDRMKRQNPYSCELLNAFYCGDCFGYHVGNDILNLAPYAHQR